MAAKITKTLNQYAEKHVSNKNDAQNKIKYYEIQNATIVFITNRITSNHYIVISLKIRCFLNKLEIGQLISFSTTNITAAEPNLCFTYPFKYSVNHNPISHKKYHLWCDQSDRLSQQYSIKLNHIDILNGQHPQKIMLQTTDVLCELMNVVDRMVIR